ncbi:MAG: asparagine synthase-related protein, partial [Vicinamibacterales bacterium]
NRTLFKDIALLPGGSIWTIPAPSDIRKRQYFTPAMWSDQPLLDASQFETAFVKTMSDVLPTYFRSPNPVGLSLTGGLDTRILTAGMPQDAKPAHAYTYAGIYRDCFDIRVARDVANVCGVPHDVLGLQPDFFQDFESHAAETVWVTDGTLDVCGAHEIYYSRQARALSPIRLTGNYGSEVLRSVSTFKPRAPGAGLLDADAARSADAAVGSFRDMRAGHPVTFAAFKEIPWNLYGRLAAAQSQLVLRSPYMDNALVELVYRAPAGSRETNEASLRLIAEMKPDLASIETDMAYGGRHASPVATLKRLSRYAQFKAEWYYNAGMPEWLARLDRTRALRLFEPLFLGSHKIDHYRLWFQRQLKPYVQDLLTDARSRARPYLDPHGFERLVSAHATGRGNCLNDLNKVMTLELVHRQLLERHYD